MITRFEHAIVDPIGVIVSPFFGIVATPIVLLGAAIKTVEAWFYGRNVPEECRGLDINKYEANLTGRDITWLKSERSRLQAVESRNECLDVARTTAKLIIPIFGYISVFYSDSPSISKTHGEKISWLTWHINDLEGRHDKTSWRYKWGFNLPN